MVGTLLAGPTEGLHMGLLRRNRDDQDKDRPGDHAAGSPTEAMTVAPLPPPPPPGADVDRTGTDRHEAPGEPDRTAAMPTSPPPEAAVPDAPDTTETHPSPPRPEHFADAPSQEQAAPVDEPTREQARPATAGAAAPTLASHAVPDDHDSSAREAVATRPTGGDDGIPVKVRERTSVFAPGQLVSVLAGGALVVLGAVALVRAGAGEPLDTPVVEVLGFDHTAWLALAEIGLGLLLMLVGSGTWGRWISVLLGSAAVAAGVIVLIESDGLPEELALERDFGWPLLGLGAVVALAAMVLPVWRTTHTTMRASDLRNEDQSRSFWSRR